MATAIPCPKRAESTSGEFNKQSPELLALVRRYYTDELYRIACNIRYRREFGFDDEERREPTMANTL